jgi:excisionase family DNA binding protein
MTTDQRESQRLLTVPEVANKLRLSRGTIYKLIRTGVVPAVRLGDGGSSLRVREDELERWLYAETKEKE